MHPDACYLSFRLHSLLFEARPRKPDPGSLVCIYCNYFGCSQHSRAEPSAESSSRNAKQLNYIDTGLEVLANAHEFTLLSPHAVWDLLAIPHTLATDDLHTFAMPPKFVGEYHVF